MSREADRPIVVRGSLRTIEYAVCANGTMPAKSFIEGLDESELRRLDTLFRRMADTGKIHNSQQFKQVEGRIYEFKRYQTRLGCFQVGDRWRLTHGFIKKSDKWPRREIERATRIRQEDLERDNATRSKGRQGKR
jgi:hypothetical protein